MRVLLMYPVADENFAARAVSGYVEAVEYQIMMRCHLEVACARITSYSIRSLPVLTCRPLCCGLDKKLILLVTVCRRRVVSGFSQLCRSCGITSSTGTRSQVNQALEK